ncbi:FAD-dependent oxidoreductase [Nocardioides marmoriginsengisoli]|uniref:FAD-dependent oxidoreductase n=1 Tax=Nocardioides marmoriginsengisoli TaxID=661483 RepID=A0A3N0CHU7_9ACTN|nr:FAD-dependent oxidoreductase [Nocardioides marmoriginsengisoli]RNL62616.1 FAD-dependent oxidoreductase [Nocardioides marmoriginsengisoli]
MPDYPHLLAPGRIGSMELRNRLVMSPMETMYGTPDGLPSARTIAYFAERAAGGVGLITVGATGIDHQHPETPGGLHLGTDASVAAHRALVEAVHAHGARIQPQIVHAGPDGLGPEMHGVTSLGPSVIPSYLTGRPSEEISVEQFGAVLDLYKAAVRRAREAGYDGIELHAAHGYMMLGSFLAPQRNRRTDAYRGDTPQGRLRAVFEALAAIRAEVGDDFPVTLRISGFERVAGGRPMYETAQSAPALVEAGVDAFHVSGGVIDRLVSKMVNGSDDGDGLNLGAAAAVRQVVDVPVIAVGRLHDPDLAEQALADGRADFVAMGRPLLADPELPRKLRDGGRVRRCISCENCIDSLEQRFSVDCAVNPRTGAEADLPLGPTRAVRHVVVVGGGPGGMEAARTAAGKGHRVTLLEADGELGGAFRWASAAHPDNAPFIEYLRAELAAAAVDVRLGERATADTIAALDPDAVIVATGARIAGAAIPGSDLPHVVDGAGMRALLAGPDLALGRRVTVLGGDLAGVAFAVLAAERGHAVAVVEPGRELAPEIGWKRKTEEMNRLDRLGVTVHVGAVVDRIEAGAVVFAPYGSGPRPLPSDSVVIAGVLEPELTLYDEIRARLPGVPVEAIGDATGLGLVRKATADAARAVAALEEEQ